MTTTEAEPWEIRATGRTAGASPLRYPGGKAALAGFFGGLIARLNISRPHTSSLMRVGRAPELRYFARTQYNIW